MTTINFMSMGEQCSFHSYNNKRHARQRRADTVSNKVLK